MRKIFAAAFKTVSGSGVALLCSAAAIKVLALMVGPTGVGLFSLLRSTQQVASSSGGFGGPTALIQGLSARGGNQRDRFLGNATVCFGISAVAVILLLLACAPFVAALLAKDSERLTPVIRWLALPVALGIALFYLTAILNASLRTGRAAVCQAVTGIAALLLAYPTAIFSRHSALAYVWLLSGSLGTGVFFGLLFSWKELRRIRIGTVNRGHAREFVSVAATTLVTTSLTYGVGLTVRAMVAHRFDLRTTGIFDVAWSLSMIYVMLVLMSFSTYYLPVLSGACEADLRRRVIGQFFLFSLVTSVPLVVTVIFLKPLVIRVLYSAEFLPALKIIRWMLIGDYFKIITWLFGIPLIAFAELRLFLVAEIVSNLLVVVFAGVALFQFGSIEFVGVGVLIIQVLYSSFGFLYCRKRHGLRLPLIHKVCWAGGLCLVVSVSVYSWNVTFVDWKATLVGLFCAGLLSAVAMLARHALGRPGLYVSANEAARVRTATAIDS